MVKSKIFMFTAIMIVSFLMLTELASSAWGEDHDSALATCGRPIQAGTLTVAVAVGGEAGNPHSTWGVKNTTITITPAEIAAGITAEQKAEKLKNQLQLDHPGADWTIARIGTKVTIHNANSNVELWSHTDNTRENFKRVSLIITCVPKFQDTVHLAGVVSGGEATICEDGVCNTVMTAGKTIPQIYEAWRLSFGKGTVTFDGFQFPERHTAEPNFASEVNDPGLTITASQTEIYPTIIPTVSEWGLIIMAGLLLTVGTVVIWRRFKAVSA